MDDPIGVAAKAVGGAAELASAMGVSPQVVSNWRVRGVPIALCAELQKVSNNSVKRWDLRPSDWHAIWPELVGTEGAPPIAVSAEQAGA